MAWACGFKKCDEFHMIYMDVSENSGFSPKSSILIRFSIINHPFWGTPIFGNTHIFVICKVWFQFVLRTYLHFEHWG